MQVYKVSQRKGCALIISNVNFSVGPNWYRRGGENDCLLMKNLFGKDGLGLDVTVKEDLTAKVQVRFVLEIALKQFFLDIVPDLSLGQCELPGDLQTQNVFEKKYGWLKQNCFELVQILYFFVFIPKK